jgi:hypothetical protein
MNNAAERQTLQARQRSVSQRASLLVAISGPYRDRIQADLNKIPFGSLVAAGAFTSFRMAMTAAPMQAVERRLSAEGPAVTADQVARRRRIKLASSVATVAAGVLAQRALTHSGHTGPVVQAGRILGSQLALGGAANALVIATDAAMRTEEAAQLSRGGGGAVLGTVVLLGQRKILRGASARLSLPMPPATTTIPVQGRWRTNTVTLPLR